MRLLALLACAGLALTGCVTTNPKQAWFENGQQLGTITKVNEPYGSLWRYVDTSGVLRRTEKRDPFNVLLSGHAVTTFSYDSSGRLAMEENFDARNAPALHPDGYSVAKYAFAFDADRNLVETRTYFDTQGRLAATKRNFACLTLVHDGAGQTYREVFFEDAQRKPVASDWDGINGVSRVKYTVLNGIGDVRCGAYYNLKGDVFQRKQIAGACSFVHTDVSTTTSYGPR